MHLQRGLLQLLASVYVLSGKKWDLQACPDHIECRYFGAEGGVTVYCTSPTDNSVKIKAPAPVRPVDLDSALKLV